MEEAALALRIRPDQIEAGELSLDPDDPPGPDALGHPSRDHLGAQGIVAERGDIVHGDAEAREIDRRVERIAAGAARIQAAARLLQLDHAFADAGYAGHDRWALRY